MKIRFCGAVDSVTGSCHMISTSRHTVLLDCGMYQGGRELEARNEAPFPFDPRDIECVLLSHAHIDHSGRLPLLVKRGFTGPIYCTDATADLLRIMLPDCAHIQQQDTERANRKAMRRGDAPKEPTYTMADVDKTLRQVRPVLYDQLFPINDQMHAVFNEAGHILGSAITELWTQEDEGTVKLVFTGDIGMPHRPILRDPKKIKKADVVIMESTYGDRLHTPNPDSVAELIHIICQTVTRGGNVIIPAFAVGRTQELIYSLNRFYESSQPPLHDILDSVDVYIDSPMAISTTQVFRRNAQVFDEETRAYILSGDNPLDFKNLRFSRTADDSRALNMDERPKVIIAASGMCDAGRIRHHLKHNLWNEKASVVFVGYQAEGTLGRALLDGAKSVTLFGEKIAVRAQIHQLAGFSGHADADGLMDWVRGLQQPPRALFLVHGEDDAKEALADRIRREHGYLCQAIRKDTEVEIGAQVRMTHEELARDMLGDANVYKAVEKLSAVRDQLDALLQSGTLEAQASMSTDRLARLQQIALQMEKDALNLGMTATEKNEEKSG